jgi:N-acetylmuramic acid 6-phosphate (MurNAc-6-P) etherase
VDKSDFPDVDTLIYLCDGSVKVALIAEGLGCSIKDAHSKLMAAGGVL